MPEAYSQLKSPTRGRMIPARLGPLGGPECPRRGQRGEETRLLQLEAGTRLDGCVYRLEKRWTLRFVLGPSLIGREVRIFADHPEQSCGSAPQCSPSNSEPLPRELDIFREIQWTRPTHHATDSPPYADIVMTTAGSFRFYFTIDGSDFIPRLKMAAAASGWGYFLVDPEIRVGKGNSEQVIPVDAIVCQTVVSKCLGKFGDWLDRVRVAMETGFNAVHFTPMQELGPYGSSYAIKDQRKVNPLFSSPPGDASTPPSTMSDIQHLIAELRDSHGMLCIADLVLNHTACETPWLRSHPHCAHSLANSPHLRPAYILDRAIHDLMLEVGAGKWVTAGVPTTVSRDEQLRRIGDMLRRDWLPQRRIAEFYQADVEEVVVAFRECVVGGGGNGVKGYCEGGEALALIYDEEYRRCKATVELSLARRLHLAPGLATAAQLEDACTSLRLTVERLNAEEGRRIEGHLDAAVHNLVGDLRRRVGESNGRGVDVRALVNKHVSWIRYFVNIRDDDAAWFPADHESMMYGGGAAYCLAHSGWLEGDVPLRNFAEPGGDPDPGGAAETPDWCSVGWGNKNQQFASDEESIANEKKHGSVNYNEGGRSDSAAMLEGRRPCWKVACNQTCFVYLRRELNSWTDSVKLRYGRGPADCPYLWAAMGEYVRETASIFQGVRLDNCHTTPPHVGAWMLREARRIRPDLYVMAELLLPSPWPRHPSQESSHAPQRAANPPSPLTVYTNQLGITALIHTVFHAHTAEQLAGEIGSKLGPNSRPIGSFYRRRRAEPLAEEVAPRFIVYDQTHDDGSPFGRNSPLNSLPVAAVIGAGTMAGASNRGYDELVPYPVSIITETRAFRRWGGSQGVTGESRGVPGATGAVMLEPESNLTAELSRRCVSLDTGILSGRRALARLHQRLKNEGFDEIVVKLSTNGVVMITRHDPRTRRSVIVAAHTAFGYRGNDAPATPPPVKLPCGWMVERVILEARLVRKAGQAAKEEDRRYMGRDADMGRFTEDGQYITGLTNYELKIREEFEVGESEMVWVAGQEGLRGQEVVFKHFPPGSVIAFMVSPDKVTHASLHRIHQTLSEFSFDSLPTQLEVDCPPTDLRPALDPSFRIALQKIIGEMTEEDLGWVLFRTPEEGKRDEARGEGFGVYHVPGYGDLEFCGLQGVANALRVARETNDLEHPLCRNVREGDWLLDYASARLRLRAPTRALGFVLGAQLDTLRALPRALLPAYLDAMMHAVHGVVVSAAQCVSEVYSDL